MKITEYNNYSILIGLITSIMYNIFLNKFRVHINLEVLFKAFNAQKRVIEVLLLAAHHYVIISES